MNRKLKNDELKRLNVTEFKGIAKYPIRIILEDIRSAGNIGSVFRSSDAFLLDKIYLSGISAKPPHREINKTALGATETVKWAYFEKTIDAIKECIKDDYKIYAVEQSENSIFLHEFIPKLNEKMAFIFGNEVEGVKQSSMDASNGVIEIEQGGTKHSINVAVCAGIIGWYVSLKFKK